MTSRHITCALIQRPCGDDPQHNLAGQIEAIRQAAGQGAQLMVLQELHNSRYFCQQQDPAQFDLAEPIPGPSSEQLAACARELGVVIVASLFEERAVGIYHNTAVVLDSDGRIAGRYRKMHIPEDPGFHEKFYFTPGDLGFTPIDTSLGRLGVLVCWDQWFPEAARLMTLAGAEILIYPTAIGWDPNDDADEQQRQLEAWITVQRGHAIANGLPLVAVNRCGFEPDPSGRLAGIQFWGHSFAAGPQGEFLARGGGQETLLLADIELTRTREVRNIWPFLRDRRIDAYFDLLRRSID